MLNSFSLLMVDPLQALGDIEIAMKVLSNSGAKSDVHPIDRHYQQLGCKMEVLDHSSETYKVDHPLPYLTNYIVTDKILTT